MYRITYSVEKWLDDTDISKEQFDKIYIKDGSNKLSELKERFAKL